jgi:hypothetical protein
VSEAIPATAFSGLQWPSGFDVPSGFTSDRHRSETLPDSRGRRKKWLQSSQYAEVVRLRLAGLPLPTGMTELGLIERFRQLDRLGPAGELKDEINEATLDELEARDQLIRGKSPAEKLESARARCDSQVEATVRRFRLLSRQRAHQAIWAMSCVLKGDLPAPMGRTLARSFLWEEHGLEVLRKRVLLPAGPHLRAGRSLSDIDKKSREIWIRVGRVTEAQDATLNARERTLLFIDAWNSGGIESVFVGKPWFVSKLRSSTIDELFTQLRAKTTALASILRTEFGQRTYFEDGEFAPVGPAISAAMRDGLASELGT